MSKLIFAFFSLAFLCQNLRGRVQLNNSIIKLRTPNKSKRLLSRDFEALMERRLHEKEAVIPDLKFRINRKAEFKKLTFMKIIASILQKAKERKLRIKSIKLGKNIRSIFENKDISSALNEYINDPNFPKRYAQEKRANDRRKRRLVQLSQEQTLQKREARKQRRLQKMSFKMAGDMTQMPFPPMVMNGPHYHPPMNITINQLPNMNPRSETSPLELQEKEYASEVKGLKSVLEKMRLAKTNFVDMRTQVAGELGSGFNAVQNQALE